jgi:CBS domain-containing protein
MPRDVDETLRETPISELNLPDPLTVQTGTSIANAIKQMRKVHKSCVLICEDQTVVGLFTERDMLNKVAGGLADTAGPIDSVMTRNPRTLASGEHLSKAIHMMTQAGYRHIPLVDDDGTVGLLTARQVLIYIAEHYPAEVLNLPLKLNQTPKRVEGG